MVIVNSENGKIITTLPIGEGVDGVAYDPSLKRAYSSNGDGTNFNRCSGGKRKHL